MSNYMFHGYVDSRSSLVDNTVLDLKNISRKGGGS